jgi:hypothetical protein
MYGGWDTTVQRRYGGGWDPSMEIDSSKSEQVRASQSKSEQVRASQSKSEQVRASQSKSEQVRASQTMHGSKTTTALTALTAMH